MGIILASASPRRKELMRLLTEDFEVCPSDAEEVFPKDIDIEKAPEYLALNKAREIAKIYPDDLVIGCDTAVFLGGRMLGKPRDAEEAAKMLRSLSGNIHKVISGCALITGGKKMTFSSETEVEFYALSDAEIEEYIRTENPLDKAGAYGIQGKAALFVKGIKGDYYNVVGLPVAELKRKISNISEEITL